MEKRLKSCKMGCYSSREFPQGSKEWLVLRVIHVHDLHKPPVRLILQALSRYPQYYLMPMQVTEVGRQLGITLDLELFREGALDLRVCKWKLLTALVMFSGDQDLQVKREAFVPFLKQGKRKLMGLMEWRSELLFKRLIDACVKGNLMTYAEATTMKLREMPNSMRESVLAYHQISTSKAPIEDFVLRSLHQVKL